MINKSDSKLIEIISRALQLADNSKDIMNISIENCDTWDSLNHMSLMSELSDYFNHEFSSDEILSLTSVKDIIKYSSTINSK